VTVKVHEVWLVSRSYRTVNDSVEDAIAAYEEGSTLEPSADYDVLETQFDETIEGGFEIVDVYED
jgi:hypothetical protein